MSHQTDTLPDRQLLPSDPLINLCRELPGATEDVKWEDRLVFSVGGKMFVMFRLPDGDSFDFKADPLTFSMLTAQSGFSPAPYLARAEWLRLHDRSMLDDEECARLLREAYRTIRSRLPRRVQQQIAQADVV